MKPHIKVIQRNGVDIFVTSSMTMKKSASVKRVEDYMQGVGTGFSGPTISDFINERDRLLGMKWDCSVEATPSQISHKQDDLNEM